MGDCNLNSHDSSVGDMMSVKVVCVIVAFNSLTAFVMVDSLLVETDTLKWVCCIYSSVDNSK